MSAGDEQEAGGPAEFSIVQRVRFGDLDAMQHLNNVEFLRFFETARIAYLGERLGGHSPTDPGEFGWIFAECQIAYRSPCHFDEDVRTIVRPGELRRSSLRLLFEMRAGAEERLAAEGYGVLVGYDYASGRARPIPDEVRALLG